MAVSIVTEEVIVALGLAWLLADDGLAGIGILRFSSLIDLTTWACPTSPHSTKETNRMRVKNLIAEMLNYKAKVARKWILICHI